MAKISDSHSTVSRYLILHDIPAFLEFVGEVAVALQRITAPEGRVCHARVGGIAVRRTQRRDRGPVWQWRIAVHRK